MLGKNPYFIEMIILYIPKTNTDKKNNMLFPIII